MPRAPTNKLLLLLRDDEHDADDGIGFAFGGFMADENQDFDGREPVDCECHWTKLEEVLSEYGFVGAAGAGGGRGGRGRGGGAGRGGGRGGRGGRGRRASRREFLHSLTVHCGRHPGAPAAASSPASFPRVFGALVAHLRMNPRLGGLRLINGNFWPPSDDEADEDEGGTNAGVDSDIDNDNVDPALQPSDADLRVLFGRILPSHPALGGITLVRSRIHPAYLRLLASALQGRSGPWWAGYRISLVETTIGEAEGCQILKQAMVRGYDDVGELSHLELSDCHIGQQGFQLVCEGIAASRALYSAEVSDGTARVDLDSAEALARAVRSPRSPLFGLSVGAGSWSDDGFAALVEALKKASPKLETLCLRSYDRAAGFGTIGGAAATARLVEDLVGAHNYNLRRLEMDPWPEDGGTSDGDPSAFQKRIQALLQRNHRAREYARRERNSASSWWPRREPFEVKCRALWPRVVVEVGHFPDLLYKVLRRGNANQFADQVELAANKQKAPSQAVAAPAPAPALPPVGKTASRKRKATPPPSDSENSRNLPPNPASQDGAAAAADAAQPAGAARIPKARGRGAGATATKKKKAAAAAVPK